MTTATRNSYGMTEEEWQAHLAEQDRQCKEFRRMDEEYQAFTAAQERGKPPTIASLKWLRPDLYW